MPAWSELIGPCGNEPSSPKWGQFPSPTYNLCVALDAPALETRPRAVPIQRPPRSYAAVFYTSPVSAFLIAVLLDTHVFLLRRQVSAAH